MLLLELHALTLAAYSYALLVLLLEKVHDSDTVDMNGGFYTKEISSLSQQGFDCCLAGTLTLMKIAR